MLPSSPNHYLTNRVILDSNNSCHKIMVSAEILGSRVIHNVCSKFQWSLKIRRHHGVVHNNKCCRASFMHNLRNPWNVCNLDQWVGGCLEQDKAGLFREVWDDSFGICGIDMVCLDIVVCCKEAEQSVGA